MQFYFPMQKLLKIVSSNSSLTVSPVISPMASKAAVKSMVMQSSVMFEAMPARA